MIDRIDWQKVTLNIRRDYKPLATVAKEIGSDWRHLNRLARAETKQPRYDTAIRLLDLHFDVCRDKHTLKHLTIT